MFRSGSSRIQTAENQVEELKQHKGAGILYSLHMEPISGTDPLVPNYSANLITAWTDHRTTHDTRSSLHILCREVVHTHLKKTSRVDQEVAPQFSS